ncbi:conserved hypothetical protein; putative Outer membrane autotransporter barrel domain [Herminiimonas arsenicoxydans]|uniref:Autotransporter domain-containing protein n=1 Tax=Herminiimonas arsenicoxydans TaxID=204773 RepID=A4G2Q9_HERAR|nr:conserved hypothetical protein; putative Outer membrane autotransporter barrel domain [Herminiimonas arsenicoxydans]
MNHSYRLIFNRSLQVWQAVSELARSAGKGGGALKKSALVLALSLVAGGAIAQVAVSGDVTPSSVATPIWNIGAPLSVGRDGIGTLAITTGGEVSNTGGYIGYNAGSKGTVTVAGPNAIWKNIDSLLIGFMGTGTLEIKDGGKVTNRFTGYIGANATGTGTVTVTGADSRWETTDATKSLIVGESGHGTLNIKGGGTVTSPYTQLAKDAGSAGTLHLSNEDGARGVLETAYVKKGLGTATFNWDGGILRATAANTNLLQDFAAGGVNVMAGGAFIDTQNLTVRLETAGVLAGLGGLTKLGSGTLNISGQNSYAGNTTISEGTLQFGTYNQSASQTLVIGARNATDYGKLHVTGTATFNPNANINVDVASVNTLAKDNILLNVITAGTLTESGFKVTDNSALFNFLAVRDNNSVNLKVVSNSSTGTGILGAVTGQGNVSARGAAAILDGQLNASAGGDMGNVINALGQLTNNRDVSRAVTQTLPLVSGTQAVQGALSAFQTLVQHRNGAGGSMTGLSSGDALSNKEAWGKVFGSRATQDDRNGTAGFTADSWGLGLGADAQVATDARFGVAYGYAKTSVNGNTDLSGTAQRANIDSHVFSAYGSKDIGNNRSVSFQGDVGVNSNESTRQLNFGGLNRTATADYRTYTAHVGAALSQAISLNAATTLTPSLRADYTWMKSQRYSETGAGALNLNVAAQKTDAFVISADAHLQHHFTAVSKIEANFGVGYDTINESGNIVAAYAGAPGQSFVTTGINHSPWLVRGGMGYSHKTLNGTTITVRYDAEGRSDYLNHTASVRANWAF